MTMVDGTLPQVGDRRRSADRRWNRKPAGRRCACEVDEGKRAASERCRREEREGGAAVAGGKPTASPRAALVAASTTTSKDDPAKRWKPTAKERSKPNAWAANEPPHIRSRASGKDAGIRCEGRPVGTSKVPPCWQGRHARGNRSASGNGRLVRPCSRYIPSGTTACCVGLSTKSPYHTHRHEPIKLLDQAPSLVVAAVARLVTAEISDDAGMSL